MDQILIFGAKYLFIVVVSFALYQGVILRGQERKNYLIIGALSCIVAFAITKSAGMVYNDPRPFTQGVHPLIPHEPDNGFPSDHTVLSFLAAITSLRYWKELGWISFAMASFVGLSRVLVGIHHPIDVFAGAAIGILSVLLVSSLMKLLSKHVPAKNT